MLKYGRAEVKVKDFLKKYKANKFFILDSHQDAMNKQEQAHQHIDVDFVCYSYNVQFFNQLAINSFFLYRRPAKLSTDHRFHIYGGGIIESISEPDASGIVIARIKNGFKLVDSIDQGDSFIENFMWKTRQKPGPGWKGFWLNYGMNAIDEQDFWNLVDSRQCYPVNGGDSEEDEYLDCEYKYSEFTIFTSDNPNIEDRAFTYSKKYFHKSSSIVKLDFNSLNKKKKTLGIAGELLVLNYEKNRLKNENIHYEIEWVANTIGDGLGYDILSYDQNGKEIHIEVKTTRSSNPYGFFMSSREIEESSHSIYKIYRVYNFDENKKTADLLIIDGEITKAKYMMKPVSYKIVGLNKDS